MTAEDLYVLAVGHKYRMPTGPESPANRVRLALYPIIKEWAGRYLSGVVLSGSYAKGTAVRGATDLDLFASLGPTTPGTLAQIYRNLERFLGRKVLFPVPQNVSIRIRYQGLVVDIVPGRRQPGSAAYHSLYRRRANTWTQTNVFKHIAFVRNSRRLTEIRAMKIWRQLNGVDFPSFFLELAVIEALKGRRYGQPAANLLQTLQWIANSLPGVRLLDPANTNNTVSDDLTATEKRTVGQQAYIALQRPLHGIIW